MIRPTSNRKGFTLVELMTVVIVIAILALIAIPRFRNAQEKAWRAALTSDMKNLASQQELYYRDAMRYAGNLEALEAEPSEGVTITINEATNVGWSATAEHEGLRDERCGYYQGTAAPEGGEPAASKGVVTCTF